MYRGWARIRDDFTRDAWCRMSRTNPMNTKCGVETFFGKYLPEACRNSHGPSNFKLSDPWWSLVTGLNAAENPDAMKYLGRWGSGWRNNGVAQQVEGLSFARNVVYVTNLNDGEDKAYVLALDVTQSPSAALWEYGRTPETFDYVNSPHLAQVFTVVTPFDTTVLPSFGDPKRDAQIYLILMQDYRQRYFETRDLEFFPLLPYAATVTVGGLNVREYPGGPVLRVAPQGETLLVTEYRPRASFVWGRVSDGWVALAAPTVNDWYTTSWSMQTLPPPV